MPRIFEVDDDSSTIVSQSSWQPEKELKQIGNGGNDERKRQHGISNQILLKDYCRQVIMGGVEMN